MVKGETNETWRSDATWAAMAAAVIGYEVYTIRKNLLDSTLTRTTRRTFRTTHPYGRAVFSIGWGYFAVWFLRHIIEGGMSEPD